MEMKKTIALILTLVLCIGAIPPFFTLGAGAAADTVAGELLYAQDFAKSTTTLTDFNSGSYASWKNLNNGTASVLRSENGVLKVAASTDLLLQILGGTAMDALAKSEDYTFSFDLTLTGGSATNYTGVQLNRVSDGNRIEVAVRLNGSGYVKAFSGGTSYSLEDDGLRATRSQILAGTYNPYPGHMLLSLANTSTSEYGGGKYTYTDSEGKTQVTRPTTLLTMLHNMDSDISDTYSATASPLKGKKLSYRIESIRGSGVIVWINGVVVSTTVKNKYYYDQLSAASGTAALFFSKGVSAEIDNLELRRGGSYSVTTDGNGIRVMSVNTLFSRSDNNYSMHWTVDENGKIRLQALLDVIAAENPDIIGFQERIYKRNNNGTTEEENDIVNALVSMGYGVIANKLHNGSVVKNPDNPNGIPSRYDAYNPQPIFYKTSKLIPIQDSGREDEYIKGGAGADEALDPQIAGGVEIYNQMFSLIPDVDKETECIVPVVLNNNYGTQEAQHLQWYKTTYGTDTYDFVKMNFIGANMGYSTIEWEMIEVREKSVDPTVITPAPIVNTATWLDITNITPDKVRFNGSKITYNGNSYDGVYYRRATLKPIAVRLVKSNPDSSNYVTYSTATNGGYGKAYYVNGYVAKTVTELHNKGSEADHTIYTPATLTHAQLLTGNYLNATGLTAAEYATISFASNGSATYNGVSYAGVYYVRNAAGSKICQNDSKALTWSVFRLRNGGQNILVMNTHAALVYGSADYRSDGTLSREDAKGWRVDNAKQAFRVMDRVFEAYGEIPVVFTGDFNMCNDDPMYSTISARFDDAARLAPNTVYWEYSHHDPSKVKSNSSTDYSSMGSGIYPLPNYPIDHIFVSPDDFTVTGYNVLNDTADELHLSDHCALIADLTLRGVTTPGCSHENGIYREEQTVTLTAGSTADTVYYTLDGSDPATSSTRAVYTAPLCISGDTQLRAIALRDGVYSGVRTVNFADGAELAITEVICNPDGCDILEGFEVVNCSRHSVDLADYTFWYKGDGKSPQNLENLTFSWNMNHLRVAEQGKYILQPGEVRFVWVVFDDVYKHLLQSQPAVEFVSAEGLANADTLSLWASLGYTGLDGNSVGKAIYRTDRVAAAFRSLTGGEITQEQVVPLETTAASYRSAGEKFVRKDNAAGTLTGLYGKFNLANSHYTRLLITYTGELTAANAFSSALVDNRYDDAKAGFDTNADGSIKSQGVLPGSFEMLPTVDGETGHVSSLATAFRAWGKNTGMTVGTLAKAQTDALPGLSSVTVRYLAPDGTTLLEKETLTAGDTVTLPDAGNSEENGIFCGWRDLADPDGTLFAPGTVRTVEADTAFVQFFIGFRTVAGASVRTTEGSTGLRFLSTVNRAEYEELIRIAGAENVTQGTFIVPQFYVENAGGFDIERFAKYLDIPAKAWYRESDTEYTLAGSVANIYANHYDLAYAGCAYLKIRYTDGTVRLLYAALPENGSRTVAGVAYTAYHDRADSASAAYPYFVAADGNYSRYTAKQLAVMEGFMRLPLCLSYNGTDFTVISGTKVNFTWTYLDNTDTVTLTLPEGEKWSIGSLFVDGLERSFLINGNKLTFSYSFYTVSY